MFGYNNIIENITPGEVLIYLRKSRSDDPTLTVEEVLEKHEQMLDEWAEKNLGGKVPEENRFYEVVSGETIKDRPEINKVLRMIESPKYKAVLAYDVERISRGDLEDAGRLIKLFRYTNTFVFTKDEVYDIRNERDREDFERKLKRGNEYLEYFKKISNNGRLLAVSQGNYLGNIPPYGFNKVEYKEGKRKCHTLEEKKEEADIVRLIFDLYVNKDMGYGSICSYLDEMAIKPPKGDKWSPPSMRDMLQNVHYIGKTKWNWRKTITVVEDSEIVKTRPKAKVGEYLIYEGKHKGIVPEELFEAAQKKQGKNPRVKNKAKMMNPLAGIFFCKCGRAMIYREYKKKDGTVRTPPRFLCSDQAHCKTGSILYDEMIDRICAVLEQCIADFEIRIKNNEGDSAKLHTRLISNLEEKLKELNARELSQWEAQSDPNPANRMPPEIFQQLNAKLLKEKEEVQQALCKAKENLPAPVNYEEKVSTFREALNALKNPKVDIKQKNRLLKACIERIDYSREKPERLKGKTGQHGGWTTPEAELDIKLKV